MLKGFFSNGITMIVKESIHKLIIQAYYLILKALNKYPSPAELVDQAGQVLGGGVERTGEVVREGYEGVKVGVGSVVESGKEAGGTAVERAGVMGNNVSEAAKTAGSAGKDAAMNAAERVGVVGNNARETAKTTGELASKDAGHLLGNAQDQLGDKLVGVGNGLKSEKD